MRTRAAFLVFATGALYADDGAWTVPEVSTPKVFLEIQNGSRAYTLTPSKDVDKAAIPPERVELPLSPEEREELVACRNLIEAEQIEEAQARLGAVLEKNTANHDARMLLGLVLHRRGMHKEAVAELRESLIGNRRNPEAWKLLKEVARKVGKRVVQPALSPRGWIGEPADDGSVVLGYADAGRDGDVPWSFYIMARAAYRHEGRFQRDHPDAKEYRFTFREQLFALGAAIPSAEAEKSSRRSKEFKALLAEKKAGTLVPFVFFALYPEPLPLQPERDFETLKPILEKYFNERVLR